MREKIESNTQIFILQNKKTLSNNLLRRIVLGEYIKLYDRLWVAMRRGISYKKLAADSPLFSKRGLFSHFVDRLRDIYEESDKYAKEKAISKALKISYRTDAITHFWQKQDGMHKQLKKYARDYLIGAYKDIKNTNEKIRVLCAEGVVYVHGLATFITAHRIAILMREWGIPGDRFEIYALDTAGGDLVKAWEGHYSRELFRNTDKRLRDKYFEKIGGHFKVKSEVSKSIIPIHLPSLLDFDADNQFHLITYRFKEYILERSLEEEAQIITNIFSGSLINSLVSGGLIITTAQKWFEQSGLLERMAEAPESSVYIEEGREMMGKVYAYFKMLDEHTHQSLDDKFINIDKDINRLANEYNLALKSEDMISRANDLAKEVHFKQTRENGEPYLLHPLVIIEHLIALIIRLPETMNKIIKVSGLTLDEISAITLLHDTVEGCDSAEDKDKLKVMIAKKFGGNVFLYVHILTKNLFTEENAYFNHVLRQPDIIIIIKILDRIHNLETPRHSWSVKVAEEYLKQTLDFIQHSDLPKEIIEFLFQRLSDLYTTEIDKAYIKGDIKIVYPWYAVVLGKFIRTYDRLKKLKPGAPSSSPLQKLSTAEYAEAIYKIAKRYLDKAEGLDKKGSKLAKKYYSKLGFIVNSFIDNQAVIYHNELDSGIISAFRTLKQIVDTREAEKLYALAKSYLDKGDLEKKDKHKVMEYYEKARFLGESFFRITTKAERKNLDKKLHAGFHDLLGVACCRLDKGSDSKSLLCKEAEKHFSRAMELDKFSPHAFLHKAQYLLKFGRHEDLTAILNDLIVVLEERLRAGKVNDGVIWFRAGEIYAFLHGFERKAERAFVIALKLDKNNFKLLKDIKKQVYIKLPGIYEGVLILYKKYKNYSPPEILDILNHKSSSPLNHIKDSFKGLRQNMHILDSVGAEMESILITIDCLNEAIEEAKKLQVNMPDTIDLFFALRIRQILGNIYQFLRFDKITDKTVKIKAKILLEDIDNLLWAGNPFIIKKLASLRKLLNDRINTLIEQKERYGKKLWEWFDKNDKAKNGAESKKEIYPRIKKAGDFEDPLKQPDSEFGIWLKQNSNLSPDKQIIKYYQVRDSLGIRGPPPLKQIKIIFNNPHINILTKLIFDNNREFDALPSFKKYTLIREIILKNKLSAKDRRLLQLISFTPYYFAWDSTVPYVQRENIAQTLMEKFGLELVISKNRLDIKYIGDGSSEDWFMRVIQEKGLKQGLSALSMDKDYWLPKTHKELMRWLKKYDKGFKSRGIAGDFMAYHSIRQIEKLHKYILRRKKQVYRLEHKNLSGQKSSFEIIISGQEASSAILSQRGRHQAALFYNSLISALPQVPQAYDNNRSINLAPLERIFKRVILNLPWLVVSISRSLTGNFFKVSMPIFSLSSSTAAFPLISASSPLDNHESILIVDDEECIRETFKIFLEENFFVETAASAEEALVKINDKAYDLIITDLTMPGMGGLALVERIKQSKPGQKVIAMSAYSPDYLKVSAGPDSFLQKPVKFEALLSKIKEILESSSPLAEEVIFEIKSYLQRHEKYIWGIAKFELKKFYDDEIKKGFIEEGYICSHLSYVLSKVLSEQIKLVFGQEIDASFELEAGYVNISESMGEYAEMDVWHTVFDELHVWIRARYQGNDLLLIDPARGQYDRKFSGKILVDEYNLEKYQYFPIEEFVSDRYSEKQIARIKKEIMQNFFSFQVDILLNVQALSLEQKDVFELIRSESLKYGEGDNFFTAKLKNTLEKIIQKLLQKTVYSSSGSPIFNYSLVNDDEKNKLLNRLMSLFDELDKKKSYQRALLGDEQGPVYGPFIPAPMDDLIDLAIEAGIKEGRRAFDFGFGDARNLYIWGILGANAEGYEANLDVFEYAKNIYRERIEPEFPELSVYAFPGTFGNGLEADFSKFDVVYYYLAGSFNEENKLFYRLADELRPGAKFILYCPGLVKNRQVPEELIFSMFKAQVSRNEKAIIYSIGSSGSPISIGKGKRTYKISNSASPLTIEELRHKYADIFKKKEHIGMVYKLIFSLELFDGFIKEAEEQGIDISNIDLEWALFLRKTAFKDITPALCHALDDNLFYFLNNEDKDILYKFKIFELLAGHLSSYERLLFYFSSGAFMRISGDKFTIGHGIIGLEGQMTNSEGQKTYVDRFYHGNLRIFHSRYSFEKDNQARVNLSAGAGSHPSFTPEFLGLGYSLYCFMKQAGKIILDYPEASELHIDLQENINLMFLPRTLYFYLFKIGGFSFYPFIIENKWLLNHLLELIKNRRADGFQLIDIIRKAAIKGLSRNLDNEASLYLEEISKNYSASPIKKKPGPSQKPTVYFPDFSDMLKNINEYYLARKKKTKLEGNTARQRLVNLFKEAPGLEDELHAFAQPRGGDLENILDIFIIMPSGTNRKVGLDDKIASQEIRIDLNLFKGIKSSGSPVRKNGNQLLLATDRRYVADSKNYADDDTLVYSARTGRLIHRFNRRDLVYSGLSRLPDEIGEVFVLGDLTNGRGYLTRGRGYPITAGRKNRAVKINSYNMRNSVITKILADGESIPIEPNLAVDNEGTKDEKVDTSFQNINADKFKEFRNKTIIIRTSPKGRVDVGTIARKFPYKNALLKFKVDSGEAVSKFVFIENEYGRSILDEYGKNLRLAMDEKSNSILSEQKKKIKDEITARKGEMAKNTTKNRAMDDILARKETKKQMKYFKLVAKARQQIALFQKEAGAMALKEALKNEPSIIIDNNTAAPVFTFNDLTKKRFWVLRNSRIVTRLNAEGRLVMADINVCLHYPYAKVEFNTHLGKVTSKVRFIEDENGNPLMHEGRVNELEKQARANNDSITPVTIEEWRMWNSLRKSLEKEFLGYVDSYCVRDMQQKYLNNLWRIRDAFPERIKAGGIKSWIALYEFIESQEEAVRDIRDHADNSFDVDYSTGSRGPATVSSPLRSCGIWQKYIDKKEKKAKFKYSTLPKGATASPVINRIGTQNSLWLGQTIDTDYYITKNLFGVYEVLRFTVNPQDGGNKQFSFSPVKSGPLSITRLLADPLAVKDMRRKIAENNGDIIYWVHPLYVPYHIELLMNELRGVYDPAGKYKFLNCPRYKAHLLSEYEKYKKELLDYLNSYKGPLFVASGYSLIKKVDNLFIKNGLSGILVFTKNAYPEPIGMKNYSFSGKYFLTSWAKLDYALRYLGVKRIFIIGERYEGWGGCVVLAQSGFKRIPAHIMESLSFSVLKTARIEDWYELNLKEKKSSPEEVASSSIKDTSASPSLSPDGVFYLGGWLKIDLFSKNWKDSSKE
ncbi:MAG: hypothetical protein COV72_03775, partial [Candidatus Omnitrophica bacterium CG11_big_fil_rev_8_21_14_0_20_42_13]